MKRSPTRPSPKRQPPQTAEAAYVAEATVVPYTHWFGAVPATVEPSRPIVYAGTALVLAIAAAIGIDAGIIAAAHAVAGWSGIVGDMNGGLAWLIGHLSLGRIDGEAAETYSYAVAAQGGALRVTVSVAATLAGLVAGVVAWRWAARPQVVGVKHLRGPRLLEGEEALAEARRYAVQRRKGDKTNWPLFSLPLIREERVWLPKDVISRSILIYGSPGAGKTVVFTPMVQTLIAWKGARALVWDPKSDYTSSFYGLPGVAILSPYDERSVHWSVGQDCLGSTGAQVLASVLASGGGTNGSNGAQSDFFQQAATTVLVAALETIQEQHGTAWGWDTFSAMFSTDRAAILKTLLDAGHAEVDELIGTADAKSSSVMATVGNAIAMTRTLGRAWPYRADRPKSKCFSVREWMSDEYDTKHRPRILLVKGDDFPELIGRCLVAMTNMIAIGINGLEDNERGRCIAVVCDELAALKSRISIAEAISTGRSKGFFCALGLQDLSQISSIYSPEITRTIASMSGLHIVGRTNMGSTRDEIAEHLGRRVVAVRAHGTEHGTVTEQEQPVVLGSYLSHNLGPFGRVVEKDADGNKRTRAQGVRLLVHGLGPNVLRLEWPIVPLPKRAPGKVPAKWTLMPEPEAEPVKAVEVVVEQASAEAKADRAAETGSGEITTPDTTKEIKKATGPILAPADTVTAITTETPSIAGGDMSWAE
jgi:hypothetical protein